ncbi:MAG: YhcH/YjgK/YiaL family protein [Spirochaetia bacterium]|nr:YhcH/YjgK/YiaL family protein [Spirochaetia bacterium]
MVVDKLENAHLYFGLGSGIEKALRFIQNNPLDSLSTGKHEIEQEKITLSINEYATKNENQAFLEAHEKNIDVQYMIRGREKMGHALRGTYKPHTDYDNKKDIQFFEGMADFFCLSEGMFAVFFSTDLHMPGLQIHHSEQVKKAVIKVRVSE